LCHQSPGSIPSRPSLLEGTINASTAAPPTVPDLLDSRAADQPGRTALQVYGGGALTFGAWRERAVRAARGLASAGIGPGDLVALRFADRDWDRYAVAFLAVHYAGAAGLPLRADLAGAEAVRLAARCGAKAVVRGPGTAPLTELAGAADHTLSALESAAAEGFEPPRRPAPADPAQVIGTSGTTGDPKGVLASHANLTVGHTLRPRCRSYAHSQHAVHAFPIGTNAAQMMLIATLTGAPTTVVLPRFDAEDFGRAVEELGAGTAFLVPSMAIELLNSGVPRRRDLSTLLLLSSSAAALPAPVARALTEALPKATVVNVYTSAEAVPAQISMVVDPARPGSVGRPADPGDLRVLGPDGAPVPPGTAGEVWLRQPGPPRSYIGDPVGGAAVFRDGWVRMGDLGRLDEDGHLHLVDRECEVIKSGALKVSTLRIEDALHEHPAVADAAALGIPHPVMGAVPVAVVVPAPGGIDVDELRLFLSTRLARAELPVRVLLAEDLPRNATGKVQKHRLRPLFEAGPQPGAGHGLPAPGPGGPPATPAERDLAEVWQEVLGRPVRDVTDEFFVLGGDSFRAVQLAAAVSARFGVDASTELVFGRPSLRAQAAWLTESAPGNSDNGTPADAPGGPAERTGSAGPDGATAARGPESGGPGVDTGGGAGDEDRVPPYLRALREQPHEVPLTAQQENFLDWMAEEPGRDAGAVSALFRVTDRLDAAALGRAVTELVRRHPSLRTRFVPVPGAVPGLVRTVLDEEPRARLTLLDRPGAGDDEVDALLIAERDRLTDLGTDPVARLLVISRAAEDHIVLLAVHHMVADGWSVGVLLHELGLAYDALRRGRAPRLPEQPVGYRDLVRESREHWPAGRRHFAAALAGAPSAIDPFPGRRPTDQVLITSHPFTVGPGPAGRLRERAGRSGVTPFMAVAALWSGVLAERSGREDLVLMSPVPGRTRPEARQAVGCLVQSLLLRVDCSGRPGFAELAERVRHTATGALDHQLYPYAEFKPSVVAFPAWLRYENWAADAHLPGLLCEPWVLPKGSTVPWPQPGGDLGVPELTVVEQRDGSLDCWIQYNSLAFDEDLVVLLADDFSAALSAACP
jgi:acyl-CoA synthetase (AMP-forming)/AMP-acid ligase II/acyl carrier protein